MKHLKILLLTILIGFIPVTANAEAVNNVDFDVEKVYINANVDMLGSIHVQEAIIIKGSLNGFERKINFRNSRLGEWDGGTVDFSKSAIYNAKSISLSAVKSFHITKEEIDWNVLDNNVEVFKEVTSAVPGDSGVYTLTQNYDGYGIRVYNPNSSGYVVYYFDFYVNQAVVMHNDVAELYWTFIPQDFDDIKEAEIQVLIPGSCKNDVFRFWAHGPLNGNISGLSTKKDDEGNDLYRGVYAKVQDVEEGQGTDIRMTFDKSLVAAGSSLMRNSGVDALDEIIKVETGRADDANRKRTVIKVIFYGLYAMGIGYLIGLVFMWYRVYKKFDKEYDIGFDMKYYREFTGDYGVEVVDYLMDKNVGTEALSASIMNLIYKKNIQVIENPNDKKNPTLKLISRENLSPAEEKVINLLYNVVTKGDSVTTKEIEKCSSKLSTAEKFMKAYDRWKDEVETAGVNEGFFEDHTGDKGVACLYLLLGALICGLIIFFNAEMPLLFGIIVIASIVYFIYVISFKKWSKKGREHYLKWKGFKNFLKDFGAFKDKELPEIALWEKYLVYATVFGLAKEVQKTMKVKLSEMGDVDQAYVNSWMFHNNYYIGNSIAHSVSHAYTGSTNRINAANASSSSSSGGGFGGGFSSGGGFGGGGGGGHGF